MHYIMITKRSQGVISEGYRDRMPIQDVKRNTIIKRRKY
jgi:hypothetical protein